MARDSSGALSGGLLSSATPVTGVPLTLSCWARRDGNADSTGYCLAIRDADDEKHFFALLLYGNSPTPESVQAVTRGGNQPAQEAVTSLAWTVGTWHHVAAVFAADDDRRAYLDGGNKGTNATSRTPSGLDVIGLLLNPLPRTFGGTNSALDTQIAHAAIHNVALTDAEIAALAAGAHPYSIRPANLVAFWPLSSKVDGANDIVGGYDLSETAPVTGIRGPSLRGPSCIDP